MADSINANGINSSNFLPRVYRSDANKKFIQATVDQLVQPGTVKKINGYIGRQNSKATTNEDIFISTISDDRKNYQLEPGFTIKDNLDNVTFFKDYQDYINQLGVFGANVSNHSKLSKQEFYAWNPHIDWDKFVNFQNYYWLPNGPDLVKIAGQQLEIQSTYQVKLESELNTYQYLFTPNGLSRNPTLKLFRGQTYTFEIDSIGQPFSIKTTRNAGSLNRYHTVDFNQFAVETGTVTITIPFDAPNVLYYVSEANADVGGVIQVLSIEENTAIDVEAEIVGKTTYTFPSGASLSNGMLVSFIGNVTPATYATGQYYVEGVGSAITLINKNDLELISAYTKSEAVLFDTTPFDNLPFSDASALASSVDYHVINRASLDKNPWTRYNRWFHKDVIDASATLNEKISSLDQNKRAVRPIIEFEAGLKLFNFGTIAIPDVDLVDTFTTDVFSTIEGTFGYNVDGVSLVNGQRILFTADTDIFVKNKIYRVEILDVLHYNEGSRQIHLVLESEPVAGQTVIVKQGELNSGLSYWYDGSVWNIGQQKTSINQTPLFDLVDANANSFGDITNYEGSTFKGTKLFSYKQGTGTIDANLGFALSYKNISNTGDIVFNFNILTDTFQYKKLTQVINQVTDIGYLVKVAPLTQEVSYPNGWNIAQVNSTQAAIRIYKNTGKTNKFDIDLFDDINNLEDLVVKVYVNGSRLDKSLWTLVNTPYYKQLILNADIALTDILTIRAFSNQPINANGFYEIPINLQNNPLNGTMADFTLGEVIDHVSSIVDNLDNFKGSFPGTNNIRDLGDVSAFGTKFVQHSGPASLSVYHITSQSSNVIKAIEQSRDDYNRFKRNFINIIDTLEMGDVLDIVPHVNAILEQLNKDKPNTGPYYFSDMLGYTANSVNTYTVIDARIKTYPVNKVFDLDTLSNRAVYVYHNTIQLLYDIDYTFDSQGFVVINTELAEDDTLTIYEYENTDGCFIPATPAKLGILPKYEPKKYWDTSLVTPRWMLQGHDGSQVLAYEDYRDDLILEVEKRIFNNIKINYDPSIFDILKITPSYIRETDYSISEFNEILAPQFYKWTSLVDRDFSKPLSYDRTNSFTFNYSETVAPNGKPLPGYWRGVYRWILDTDRPHICPWEMLGLSTEPSWWQSVYGPAPYTSDNLVLWQDLSDGLLKAPGQPSIKFPQYVRPFLMDHIPVDAQGNLLSPYQCQLSNGEITQSTSNDFVFGDVSPIEAAWRRSSHYPFSLLITALLMQPANTFGVLLDRSRIVRNLAGQLVYKDTGLRVTPADVVLPSIYSSTTRVQTAGVINYVVDYILSDYLKSYSEYAYDLQNIFAQISYRIGAFTSKEKFNLLLDSKTPLNSGSVFVPQEDYNIVLNSSSPLRKIIYSGVIITRLIDGYEVKGYTKTSPSFKYFPYTQSGPVINVGGISDSFSNWLANEQYFVGKIVKYANKYYRVKVTHTSTETFEQGYFTGLAALPVSGGRDAITRVLWDRTSPIVIPYGTKFRTVQETYDFLVGYGEYLKDQGFIFDDFNANMNTVSNWQTSAKEFLFWTTQNWSSGQDKWDDWLPEQDTEYQSIVRYNGDFYQAVRKSLASAVFKEDDFVKLDGLSTVGSSVISLSPAATKLTFSTPYCVVDDIKSAFNGYEVYKVDGSPVVSSFIDSYREDNAVSYTPRGDEGIFGATFYLIQKEQVVLLNNTTMFGDVIYNQESGYRQERIKVSGYVSTGWYGAFNAPGFIFDQAYINDWTSWTDYALGDIVKYKEFYYSALSAIVGAETFTASEWTRLDSKPTPKLLPNWSYKASQFTDFYSLDSDNFDLGQQQVAQHLVGYQKRQYLANIIKDDVSEFKFYQGMIAEKGTQNVFNKLFDVFGADGKESLKFYEEWALRVGQYGANAAFENIEFTLDEAQFKNNPQGFELVQSIDSSVIDFIIRQTTNDVYLKPLGYNNNPWPIKTNYKPYLRTPGFVRTDEVRTVLTTIDKLLLENIDNYSNGEYVWVGFEGRDWNVYRYTPTNLEVTNVTYSAGTLTIETDSIVTLNAGTYIGIESVAFKGFYKIASVSATKIIINTTITGWTPFSPGTEVPIFALTSQLANSIDDTDTTISPTRVANELLWTTNSGDGKWATWQYNNVFSESIIVNTTPSIGLEFGKTLALNSNGNTLIVSDNSGQLSSYGKPVPGVPWTKTQIFTVPFIANDVATVNPNLDSWIGEALAMSPDGYWLAVGHPKVGNAATNYLGLYNSGSTYTIGQIVQYNAVLYQAIRPVPSAAVPSSSSTYWKLATLIETVITGTEVGPTGTGAVSIYFKNSIGLYSFLTTFVSPLGEQDEQFGSNLAFGDNVLFVTAKNLDNSGSVYQMNYATRIQATALYNPVGSSNTTIKVSDTTGISVGMTVVGTGFTAGQLVTTVVDGTTLTLNAAADGDPFGRLSFTLTGWAYNSLTPGVVGEAAGSQCGSVLAVSKDSSTLAVSAPGTSQNGKVFVYKNIAGAYTLDQTIAGTEPRFGQGLTISDSADYLAISSILFDGTQVDQGSVTVYKKSELGYTSYQTITNRTAEQSELFGSKIYFMNDYSSLVIYSASADSKIPWELTDETTFDDSLTSFFLDGNIDSGRVDIYDRYASKWIYGESLSTSNSEIDGYGSSVVVGSNQVFVSAKYAEDRSLSSGQIYNYFKKANTSSWTILHKETDKIDLTKIKSAFLYNKKTNKLIEYIDIVDPVQGKIPGPAEQELKFKTFYDPAVYSTGDASVNVDDGIAWKKSQVGMLWWDLRTAKFIDSYDTDPVYRNSTWNSLFPGASIDIYEWVESKLKPAEWNLQADTEAGLANGISGTSLYDNTIYSSTQRYDSVSKSFKNTYYYWVKNKKTIPNVAERYMSAQDTASLIGNTRGQGYTYLALTSSNSFSLVNASTKLYDNDVVLSVQYWITDYKHENIHSQWKLISNNVDTKLPASIEQKWFDSLCGKDEQGRLVPDPALPPKLLYGVENRPRQGMFINRFEALKQFIERVNLVLIKEQIVGQRDLSLIESYQAEPAITTGLYDVVFDTDLELRFANIGSFTTPRLTPTVVNGSITGINIVSAGRGYVEAPYIDVIGAGIGAVIKAKINTRGQIIGADIVSPGYGYTDDTSLSIRNFSALVHADLQSTGNWSIYTYDPSSKIWSRTQSQSYDTRNYWTYADWYADGYSEFSVTNYAVDTFSDLNSLTLTIGQTVKIRTSSSGTWFLLLKYAESTSIDWTQSYKVVGQENGTIQFSSGLYSFADTSYGFDGSLYDNTIYDNSATIELRNILTALKNNILRDTLEAEYLNLFFASVRYALSEQTYLDWIFKTSFVKAQHNVGALHQPVTYKNDNLTDFENYVSEVKPYRTKVREYISSYNKTDPAATLVTDFDLQPAYENGGITVVNATVSNEQIVTSDIVIDTYPWKNWLDNSSYKITSLDLVDNGANYHSAPVVRFISKSGTGAKARAFIANGKVNRIVLLNAGSGYLAAPTVVLEGGLEENGTPARAVAIIGDGVTRSQLIKMKFDRITRTYFITQLEETETFTGTASRLQFPLKWAPDVRIGKSSVTVNGVDILRDDYKLVIVKSVAKGYTSYSGSIIFESAPAKDLVIVVNYIKDWSLLNAADRIQYYYNPVSGEIGKDLSQLMTGVDYGGVVVNGLGFDVSQGWDSVPYFSERWDSVDPTFDDYIVTTGNNDHAWTLPYLPAAGTELNIYHIKLNTDTAISDGTNLEYTYNTKDVSPKVSISRDVTTAGVTAIAGMGSSGTVLKVLNSAGITAGMRVIGTEFTTQTVASVQNATTVILSAAPSLPPSSGVTLAFTKNISGLDVLTVASTTGLAVGDIVTSDGTSAFALNTTVTQIINSTQVKLDQILFDTVVDVDEANINPPNPNISLTFTRQLTKSVDFTLTGFGIMILTAPAPSGSNVNVYSVLEPIKIDDLAYGTPVTGTWTISTSYTAGVVVLVGNNKYVCKTSHTSSATTFNEDLKSGKWREYNDDAIMETIVSTGISSTPDTPTYDVAIPNTYTIVAGDQIIIRKSTSDGSIAPQEDDYDTSLTGGDFAYTSASGLLAEDIIVDGDGFVTPTTSPATEEVVPGHVFDTLAIKVFDKPYRGSASIKVDNYKADGISKVFTITQKPNSKQAVIVKVTTGTMTDLQVVSTDYTVDYIGNSVEFVSAPAANSVVSIFSFGFSGENVLDLDYFIGNNETTEFITRAPWLDKLTYLIYLNGEPSLSEIFRTDDTYESSNRVGIRFGAAPASDDVITFVIVAGEEQTFAITKTERIATDGRENLGPLPLSTPLGTSTYDLVNRIGDSLPVESSMLVRVNQKILKAPTNAYFTIKSNKYTYSLDPNIFPPYSIDVTDLSIYADGNLLVIGTDYTINLAAISVKITQNIATRYNKTTLIINVKQADSYTYIPQQGDTPPQITFDAVYSSSDVVEIISSYKHDILDIQRTTLTVTSGLAITPDTVDYYTYVGITGGTINLDRAVIDDSYVWVTKNGDLLVPNVDFVLSETRQQLKLTEYTLESDEIGIVTYGSNILQPGIAYMQFKDMLNRTHFKRLSLRKQTQLVRPLKFNDLSFEVNDASNFDVPNPANNRPGVVEIRGERIEYFKLEGNVLSQLRRATLGTGAPMVHPFGSFVQDIGPSETMPYKDTNSIKQLISDGSTIVPLDFVPASANDIEVFVGGYNIGSEWVAGVDYVAGTIVTVGSYNYRCIANHSSSLTFLADSANWQFFIGNIRLKKAPHTVYNANIHPDSPDGDVEFDAEFTVDGTSSSITLTTPLAYGTHVTIVKRTGSVWDSEMNILNDDNKVATFLKATPGVWYVSYYKYQNTQNVASFDSNVGSFDSDNITFDRG